MRHSLTQPLVAHLDHSWSDEIGTGRSISTGWQLRPVPGLQVKRIHLHLALCICPSGMCKSVVMLVDQDISLATNHSHATAQCWLWHAPCCWSVLPDMSTDVKAPQCICSSYPLLPPHSFSCIVMKATLTQMLADKCCRQLQES